MPPYIQLQPQDVQKLSKAYGLTLVSYDEVAGGASNTSIVLHTTTGQYVLTVFDNKTLGEVSKLARVLVVLEESDFPATRLIPAKSGALMISYADHPVILKHYIKGEIVEDLSPHALEQTGRTLAQLHLIQAPEFLIDTLPYNYHLFPEVCGLNIDPEFETWLANRHTLFAREISEDLPRGILHGDLEYDNILFDQGKLAAFLDFEDVCHNLLIFDVAMALLGLCREGTTLVLDKVQAFIRGYSQVRSLEEGEVNSLQLWTNYATTTLAYWRFWKYNIRFSIPEKTDTHWEHAHFADHVQAIPEERFRELISSSLPWPL